MPDGVEAEWVSDRGEVKEAALWSGRLASTTPARHRDRRTAAWPRSPTRTTRAPAYAPVGGFLYEPDGAVIRAGLVTAVAAGVDGGLLDPHIAYVTGDEAFRTPFARGYRVARARSPTARSSSRPRCASAGIGTLTIKKRGVAVSPDELRQRLGLRGDATATLVLTRVAGHGTALLVEPF